MWLQTQESRTLLQVMHEVTSACADIWTPGWFRTQPPATGQSADKPGENFVMSREVALSYPPQRPGEAAWHRQLVASLELSYPQQKPVSTDHYQPDRNPLDGIVDEPTVGIWNGGGRSYGSGIRHEDQNTQTGGYAGSEFYPTREAEIVPPW